MSDSPQSLSPVSESEPVAWQFRQRSGVGKGPQSQAPWCDWCSIEREDYEMYIRAPNPLIQVRPLYAGHAQTPALPDRERMAEILYTAAHKGLRNCWKWSDAELDHEHPTSRGYWYKIADGALAALADTSTVGNSK